MKIKQAQRQHAQDGITLLVTLLLMGILLGVSTSLLNVTLKQFQLSGFSLASEMAFQAANAGMECALYQNFINAAFVVPGDGTEQVSQQMITCMGQSDGSDDNSNLPGFTDPNTTNERAISGGEQRFQFSWGSPAVCTDFSVYKFYSTSATVPVTVDGVSMRSTNCPIGSVCTVVQSRGYNVGCASIGTGSNIVEREYTLLF